jgi:nicotinate-nucleotide adenylyltransferase
VSSAGKRIGVFGGTFDPPHIGHLVAALNTARYLDLDEVLFVVASVPWQKVGDSEISPVSDRLAMVELAVQGREMLVPSRIEIDSGGDSVTVETLLEIMSAEPGAELFLILGSDAAAGLSTWRRADELVQLATIVVVDRPGSEGRRPGPEFPLQTVACPLVDLSSSELRRYVTEGSPIDYLVTDAVRDYIEDTGLYR